MLSRALTWFLPVSSVPQEFCIELASTDLTSLRQTRFLAGTAGLDPKTVYGANESVMLEVAMSHLRAT
eukprot:2461740-Heterocapsa_arctica.AAC.1